MTRKKIYNKVKMQTENDKLFFYSKSRDVAVGKGANDMYQGAVCKYKAYKEARDVLKMTKGAQLWHIVSHGKPVRFEHLESIREMNFQ